MSRWILGCGLVVAVILIIVFARGAAKTTYVNGLPQYTDLPGREYIFERDCYIFKFKDADTDWPLVGSRLTVPSLPAEVDPKNVGVELPNVRILDTVTTGTTFKIVSVRRDQREGRATITFEILFIDEASRKYPRLDAFWMLDNTAESPVSAPKILSDYAVPRRSG
jgi:hypothetical protein